MTGQRKALADQRVSVAVDIEADGTATKAGAKPWGEARRYLDECQIDGLNTRGKITDGQWRAGILFRARWLAAHPRESYAGRYKPRQPSAGGGGPELARAAQLDGEADVHAALRDMPDGAAMAVQAVAGEDEPARGRLDALRAGLDHLARFYRVPWDFKRRGDGGA